MSSLSAADIFHNKSDRCYKVGSLSFVHLLVINVIFFSFFFQKPIFIVSAFFILLFFLFFLIAFQKKIYKPAILIVSISVVFLLPGLFKIDHGLSKFFYFFLEIILIYLSFYMTKNEDYYGFSLKLTFYFFLVLVLCGLWVYREYNEPLSYFVSGSSQNGIPSYLIILLISYLSYCLICKNKIPFVPAFLVLSISFVGEGRGSIIVSAFICLLSLVHFIWDIKVSLFRIIFLIVLFFLTFFFVQDLFEFIVKGSKLSVGLKDSHRLNMLLSYIESLGGLDVLTGKGYAGTLIASDYNDNPHISYVRLHSFFGVFSVMIVLFSPFLAFFYGFSKTSIYLFLLLLSGLVRAASEPILFPTLLDFFYFSTLVLFFRVYYYKRKLKT